MRISVSAIVSATLLLAAPALAQGVAENKPAPVFPTATGFPVSSDLSHDGSQTVSQGRGSIFSARGTAIGGAVDWTGFYIGGQIGAVFGDADLAKDDESVIGGVTLGYDYDFGRWVIGGALDYDFTDLDIAPGSSIEQIFRLKLRGGPKIGRGLLYGAGGYANADSDHSGNEDGWFLGGGYEYMVNDRVSVGGEVLYHDFGSFGSANNDVDATSVQVRATFRF
ncbi:MAG: porin family protein [Rhodobacteraceae bacterium CG17_big_fil_post_rev_8_21_14_2_50_63_15]|nr:porin family protein [Roseovarius sp.]PIV79602.1 MAG: porin family protein [Rhodobacteraceae bacterium CG17_big_fil_post_rev_8_21_14_2_50_63_15]